MNLAMSQSSLWMSIMDVRVINTDLGLPDNFDIDKVKENWKDSKKCQICEAKFKLTKGKHHCRRWGSCVCSKCSNQERRLSKSNPKTYRVCDICDFKIDNQEFENTYKWLILAEEDILDNQNANSEKIINNTSQAETNAIKKQKMVSIEKSKHNIHIDEIEEKIAEAEKNLTFLQRSKRFVGKNIKNNDEMISALKEGE